jgi:hypothetical protein
MENIDWVSRHFSKLRNKDLKFFCSSSLTDNDPYVNAQGSPPWLATTYNLTYELSQFAIYFQVFFRDSSFF